VKEVYKDIEKTVSDVFRTTDHDNDPSLSIEDRRFEQIMKMEYLRIERETGKCLYLFGQ
jgi:hypothetical protein